VQETKISNKEKLKNYRV